MTVKDINKSPSYITKSADLRPVRIQVDSFDGSYFRVKSSATRPLWIPKEIVFQDDLELFRKLEKAYRTKHWNTLRGLWKEARGIVENGPESPRN